MIRKAIWKGDEVELHDGNILFRSVSPVTENDIQKILGDVKLKSFKIVIKERNTYKIEVESNDILIENIALALDNDKSIVWAEPDLVHHFDGQIAVSPDDPLYEFQWNLDVCGVSIAWQYAQGTGNEDVEIAVIDSGIPLDSSGNLSHPDLMANRFVLEPNFATPGENVNDILGHGTAVTGILGATTDNGTGIAGVNWNSKIHIYKIEDNRSPSLAAALQSIDDALAKALTRRVNLVINCSVGRQTFAQSWLDACQAIDDFNSQHLGISQAIFCVAAGNESSSTVDYPGFFSTRFPNSVISVGSSTSINTKAEKSNYGNSLTVLAPGDGVPTTVIGDDQYRHKSGTSFAAPLVSGILSLIWSCKSNLSAQDVISILKTNAVKLEDGKDFDPTWGYGIATALFDDSYYTVKLSIDTKAASQTELNINLINS